MSVATSYSAQLVGLESEVVTVEVDISNGLNAFAVVGLGDRSVDEAKDRISAAIKNSGYVSPKQKNQKVVISLAPADLRKEGPSFDLAMAIGYLSATGDIALSPTGKLFLGELSLEGYVRKISGLLPILCQAKSRGFDTAFVPRDNAREASLASNITIYAISSLTEVIEHLSGKQTLQVLPRMPFDSLGNSENDDNSRDGTMFGEGRTLEEVLDMNVIRGNETAKRGLEIAAAGGHNVIMYGPPGTGKTLLAQSFPSIIPPLSYEEAVEVTGIHSAARALKHGLITRAPFRAPHHTSSYISIVGGGAYPQPGELTLAHRGILFMDEFPEFERRVIEALRQPMEDRHITIARAKGVVTFPAHCILVASMNPCPCGKERGRGCICTDKMIEQYRRKISGPIMDRMDIWINVNKIDYEKLAAGVSVAESSETILARVIAARGRQKQRGGKLNSAMGPRDIERHIVMAKEARNALAVSAERFGLSGRAFHRVMKVAQTIADLASEDEITKKHILEALQYRQKIEA